jgi:formyl-CoA transferase
VANDKFWGLFCEAANRIDLRDDPRFARAPSRVENRAALNGILEPLFRARPSGDWIARLSAAGVPCGRIRTVGEVCTAPSLVERGMVLEAAHPTAGPTRSIAAAGRTHPGSAPRRDIAGLDRMK